MAVVVVVVAGIVVDWIQVQVQVAKLLIKRKKQFDLLLDSIEADKADGRERGEKEKLQSQSNQNETNLSHFSQRLTFINQSTDTPRRLTTASKN